MTDIGATNVGNCNCNDLYTSCQVQFWYDESNPTSYFAHNKFLQTPLHSTFSNLLVQKLVSFSTILIQTPHLPSPAQTKLRPPSPRPSNLQMPMSSSPKKQAMMSIMLISLKGLFLKYAFSTLERACPSSPPVILT